MKEEMQNNHRNQHNNLSDSTMSPYEQKEIAWSNCDWDSSDRGYYLDHAASIKANV